jgi:sulfite exporter TauE/SafE
MALCAEALLLGAVSGPACLASCGPVLVPALLTQPRGWRANTGFLGLFLSARFLGYLLFAVIAWRLGTLLSMPLPTRLHFYGIVHLFIALALGFYAWKSGRGCAGSCAAAAARENSPSATLVQIGETNWRQTLPGAALLGFLTGLSLCPPFLAAAMRAMQLGSLTAALLFFALFFAGTSLWFLPFASFSAIKRHGELLTVARMALILIALYYLVLGVAMLSGKITHV